MREERRRRFYKHFFKYLNQLTTPPPLPKHTEKPFLVSKCQNVKRCIVGGFQSSTCLLNSVRAKPNDLGKCWSEVNCRNWPIIGYIRSWYTGMRYWKQCLQAPLLHYSSPHSVFGELFWTRFPHYLGDWNRRPEQAISIVKRLIGLKSHSWWRSSMSNRLISRYQLEGSKWVC